MVGFLQKVWALTRPYRARLYIGVVAGVLAGLIEPLMIVTIVFVFGLVFPSAHGGGMADKLAKLPTWLPSGCGAAAQEWLGHLQTALAGGTRQHPMAVVLLVSLIPGIIFLRGLFSYLNIYFLQWTAVNVVKDLRVRLFAHLLQLPTGFFARNPSGELLSRVMSDTTALQQTISQCLTVLIKDPVTLISLGGLLLSQQPRLTLISLVALPLCVVPIAIYGRKARRAAKSLQDHNSGLAQVMTESFTGNRVVKAYNLERTVAAAFEDAAKKFGGQCLRIVRAMELPGALVEFFGAVGAAAVLLYLVWSGKGENSPEDFLAFILALLSMYRPIKNLTRLHNQITQAQASSARVFELLAVQNNVLEPHQPRFLQASSADIHFDKVEFAYGDKPVLRGIDLHIKAGQLVALVGASGSGKTTLANLLLRFDDPQRGAVRIGDTDIREFATRDLRNQMAVVTQETILFNETIRRNIELGRPGATEEEIIVAAKHAHAHGFIIEKPQGYETVVGEKGVMLSGGQRQRLAIARAVLRNAPILILDEATSALDTESERAVQEALDELMKGRTTICIAHRLSTIMHADVIVVLEQGRVVETGRHAELLQHGGVYKRLYDMQFRE